MERKLKIALDYLNTCNVRTKVTDTGQSYNVDIGPKHFGINEANMDDALKALRKEMPHPERFDALIEEASTSAPEGVNKALVIEMLGTTEGMPLGPLQVALAGEGEENIEEGLRNR